MHTVSPTLPKGHAHEENFAVGRHAGRFLLFCRSDTLPREIYRPRGAQVVKAEAQDDGEFEAKFHLRGNDVRQLAQRVISHARSQGFHLVESEIKPHDADLKFRRGDQELDVEIERKGHGHIEYKADLDRDH